LRKIGVFGSKQTYIKQNFDHNVGFWEKHQCFRRKLAKIAENIDHNIGPWSGSSFLAKNGENCQETFFETFRMKNEMNIHGDTSWSDKEPFIRWQQHRLNYQPMWAGWPDSANCRPMGDC
jgi:hypothetical protein